MHSNAMALNTCGGTPNFCHFSVFNNLTQLHELWRKLFLNLYRLLILKYCFAGEPDIQVIGNVGGAGDMSVVGGGGGRYQWCGGVYSLKLFVV